MVRIIRKKDRKMILISGKKSKIRENTGIIIRKEREKKK